MGPYVLQNRIFGSGIPLRTAIPPLPKRATWGFAGATLWKRGENCQKPDSATHRAALSCHRGSIPGGRYVTFMFLGPNEDMGPAYEDMEGWLAQRGLVSSGQCIEQYYNGDPFPRDLALTGVSVLLA